VPAEEKQDWCAAVGVINIVGAIIVIDLPSSRRPVEVA
jgi:hypothetical protein